MIKKFQRKRKALLAKYKHIIKIILFILNVGIIIFLVDTLGVKKGLGLFLLYILFITGIRLYRNRDNYINSIRAIEAKIWGKPLDKDMWKKDELKNRKIKVVWRNKEK